MAFLLRVPGILARTGGLCILQAIIGRREWWWLSQASVSIVRPLRGFRIPLLLSWLYGTGSRVFLPAHWRSLQFWKRVIPIYTGYKVTQIRNLRERERKVRERRWASRHAWGATKVYTLCVELRGFYLKDGQFLGSRTDFIPEEWCARLRCLQDKVPPVAFSGILETIQEEYCINEARQLFKSLETVPIASATIAQVHRGKTLHGDCDIALKSQYRNQERLCRLDLLNLKRLANFLQRFDMNFFDMHAVVREFEAQIPTEFDFVREAVQMTLVRENLAAAGITSIVVPRAIPGLVARKALCMTFVEGCRPDNFVALKLWGINPLSVLNALGEAYGQMLLVDGLAHCDPHMGNIIVKPDGRCALIDFGQTKEIPDELRVLLCKFYLAINSGNNMYIMKTFGDLGIELSIPFSQLDPHMKQLIPVYANGLFDTATLPDGIDIDPFSANSPLKTLPIRKFNQDLFMVLRTMGLLRALVETLTVGSSNVSMASIFRKFALKGLVRQEVSAQAKNRRTQKVKAALLSRVASPFASTSL